MRFNVFYSEKILFQNALSSNRLYQEFLPPLKYCRVARRDTVWSDVVLCWQLLQDYQRQYVRLEVALDRHPLRPLTLDNVASSEDSDNMSTSADDGMSELIGDVKSARLDNGYHDNTSSVDELTSPAFSAISVSYCTTKDNQFLLVMAVTNHVT